MTRAARIVVPGFDQLDPYWQGSLDRLCGIYSVVNAALLAAYPVQPLTSTQCQRMHDSGVRFLAREEHLRGVSLYGLGERRWRALQGHMLQALRNAGGPQLAAEPLPLSRTAITETLVAAIAEQVQLGRPVMLALWGAYDHFTVVGGYTSSNLLLFDSYGYQRVRIDTLRVKASGPISRHRISAGSVAALRMVR